MSKKKVVFLYAAKDREKEVAEAFLAGVRASGDEGVAVQKTKFTSGLPDGDTFCIVGVKSVGLAQQIAAEGKDFVFLDKGYFRHRLKSGMWEYWRVAVNDHHPTAYVSNARHSIRRWNTISERRAIDPKPWRTDGRHVLFAGSSQKYHEFCGLPDPTEYATGVIDILKNLTKREIVYRPKPTWDEARKIKGTRWSHRSRSIFQETHDAWCLVTNGSNSCFDAICEGIPCIVLGNAIARGISSTVLASVEHPYLASDEERQQWFANLAWCQYTEAEMACGFCWKAIRPQLDGDIFDDSVLEEVALKASSPTKAQLKKAGLWKKERPKKSKAEQRENRPFSKKRVKVGEWRG